MITSTASKTCTKCMALKDVSEFYKQSSKAGALHSWCRDCCRQKQREYRSSDAGKLRDQIRKAEGKTAEATRKYRYGLTRDDIHRMLADQSYKCAICTDAIGFSDVNVDHDHSCCPDRNKTCGDCVRSLLCKPCNLMLGYASDQPARLLAAAAYLISERED